MENKVVGRVYGINNPWGVVPMCELDGWIDIYDNGTKVQNVRDYEAERQQMKDKNLLGWAKLTPIYKRTILNGGN